MFFLNLMYAIYLSVGVIGVGRWAWGLGQKSKTSFSADVQLHPLLNLSLYWLTGYFIFEGVLSILSVIHLFSPGVIIFTGIVLAAAGIYSLSSLNVIKSTIQIPFKKGIGFNGLILIVLSGFVLFWNLYPTFDIDSLSSYFVTLTNALQNHGRVFERFSDVRLSMPLGENLFYTLGLAWNLHSTVFSQLIHGFAKVIFILGVYGAARTLGLNRAALLTTAFLVSNEHLVASGANGSVHINVQLTLALFWGFLAFVLYLRTQHHQFVLLSLFAMMVMASCKFLGLVYLTIIVALLVVTFILQKTTLSDLTRRLVPDRRFWIFALGSSVFLATHYGYNWFATGSPFFPASLGPFHGLSYDAVSAELGRRFHYGISPGEALKNVTAFMIWPGILPLKMLFPLILLSGVFAFLSAKPFSQTLKLGLGFALISVGLVILQEMYMTFEMRYYRFGIGLYSLSSAFLLAYLWGSLQQSVRIIKKVSPYLSGLVVIVFSVYAMKASFDVMGKNRPSALAIWQFVSGQKSEYAIIDEYYPTVKEKFEAFKSLNIPDQQLGVFVESNWPHVYYPIRGYHMGLVQTAAMKSESYFDQGLLAQEWLNQGIRYIFDHDLVKEANYPWEGGEVYALVTSCGKPLLKEPIRVFELSSACLQEKAAHKDISAARLRLEAGMAKIRDQIRYTPFNPPPFGSPDGVYK